MRIVKMQDDHSGTVADVVIQTGSIIVLATADPYVITVDLRGLTEKGDPLVVRIGMTRNELAHINRCVTA